MAEAELETSKLTVSQLLSVAAGIANSLEGNAHFPTPEPPLEELRKVISELAMAEKIWQERRDAASQAQIVRDEIAGTLRDALGREVAYVQEASDGEAAKILSAGLHLHEGLSLWPFGAPGDVEAIMASAGDEPGEIDLTWDPIPDAGGYEIEMTADLCGNGPWEQASATVKSKATIEHLASRGHYWFRVRAINHRGAGDWSPPVMKLAP